MTNEYNEMCQKTVDGIDDSMEISKPTIHYLDIGEAFKNGQLFQDSEGKIPVTEEGQSVGLCLYSDNTVFFQLNCVSDMPTFQKYDGQYCLSAENDNFIMGLPK